MLFAHGEFPDSDGIAKRIIRAGLREFKPKLEPCGLELDKAGNLIVKFRVVKPKVRIKMGRAVA